MIATNPAIAPEAAPKLVGCPSLNFSTTIQPNSAAAAATWVFISTKAAIPLAPSAEPALKPNQPNQSKPAPKSTTGSECGRIASFRQPTRRPRIKLSAKPAAPALICTAVPPAKSSIPRAAKNPAPVTVSPTLFPKAKTQCATGK